MSNILITFKKEFKSFIRDKKTLASLFIYPLLIPAMIVLYGFLYDSLDEGKVDVNVGVNYSLKEDEKEIFESTGLKLVEKNSLEELEKAFENNEIDTYLTYDSEANKYTIYAKTSSTDGMIAAELVDSFLSAYNDKLTKEYLVNHNINIEEAYHQFDSEIVELSETNYIITIVYAVCFMYVIMSVVIVCSNVAVSSTAAEKENGTLETILTFPVTTKELIFGKYLASVVLGCIASFASIICLVIGLLVGKEFFLSFKTLSLNIGVTTIVASVIVSIITSFFVAGCAFFLTAKARSFKEAQSKIGFLNMLTIVPMFVSLMGIAIDTTYYLIPICNSVQLLNDLFIDGINYSNLLLGIVSNIIYGVAIVYLVIKTYKNEKILFTN